MTPEQIKTARAALGITQQELSNRVGVSWNTVSRWENGKSKPHSFLQKKLKEVLNSDQVFAKAPKAMAQHLAVEEAIKTHVKDNPIKGPEGDPF